MKFIPSSFSFSTQVVIAPKVFIQVPSSSDYVSVDVNGGVDCWDEHRPHLRGGLWVPKNNNHQNYFLGTLQLVDGEELPKPKLIELYPYQREVE